MRGKTAIIVILLPIMSVACALEPGEPSQTVLLPPVDSSEPTELGADAGDTEDTTVGLPPDAEVAEADSMGEVSKTDGDDGLAGDADVDDTGPTGDGEQADTSVPDAGLDASETDSVETSGLCKGESDLSVLESFAPINVFKWVAEQGQSCFFDLGGSFTQDVPEDDYYACMLQACANKLGLTNPCAECFAEVALCSKTHCKVACGTVDLSEMSALEGCIECQIDNYCVHPFETCTGLDLYDTE
jgi:hypothetical protein